MNSLPPLLLHVCCGPCAAAAAGRLENHFRLRGFFYNPNIRPEEEYGLRLLSFQRYARAKNMDFIEGEYDFPEWEKAVKGLENEPEGGRRCIECYRMRIARTAGRAKSLGINHIATTLTAGPAKKAGIINSVGLETASASGLSFVQEDFKADGGFALGLRVCKELGMYRQSYCGCLYGRNPG